MNDLRFHLPEINTWRLCLKTVTQQDVVDMVNAWEAHGYRFGCVCIDDGWTVGGLLGDWRPDPVRFPDMRGLVDWIHERGYAARLWVAPAQLHPGTDVHRRASAGDLLRNAAGEPCFFKGLGTYRLDPRSRFGAAHIGDTMQRLVRDYAFDAFKVDFPPFMEPEDAFYATTGFDLNDEDRRTLVPMFYKLVTESVREVNPAGRVCCASAIRNCQPYIQDTICGDFVNCDRTDEMLMTKARDVLAYVGDHDIVPWLEMVWGGGGDSPLNNPAWHTGFIEYIAHSINFGLKIEHSFQPFDYPNSAQIRALTNLYGPRLRRYKVLAAGRKVFTTDGLLRAGVRLDANTRFLVAVEEDVKVTLHSGFLGTDAFQWRCRDVLSDQSVRLRGRNEFWGDRLYPCRTEFDARGRAVYELWHEGPSNPAFRDLYLSHVRKPGDPPLPQPK